jgi:hypothetical protein
VASSNDESNLTIKHHSKEGNLKSRYIVAILSDIHSGHKLGLCNPKTKLEDNNNGKITQFHPDISETQKFMWEVNEWGKEETLKIAGKDDIIFIHDGDPTHGKASFLETMTTRQSDQILIADANFDFWVKHKNVKMIRFAIGTGVHEMGEGSSSTVIAKILQTRYPDKDIGIVYHGLLDIKGFTVDYAHHGPNVGSRKWLEGNELRLYLRSIMMGEIMGGNRPPHLVIRGHYHTYRREFLEMGMQGKLVESWAMLLPGFTFKDDYTRRATRSDFKQTVGMIALEIIDGTLTRTFPYIKTVDIRTRVIV